MYVIINPTAGPIDLDGNLCPFVVSDHACMTLDAARESLAMWIEDCGNPELKLYRLVPVEEE